jgi:GAF domain-containing protein/HAMP domain-containing protein
MQELRSRKNFFNSVTFKIGIVIILVQIVVLAGTGFFYINRFTAQVDERIKARIELPGALVSRGLLSFGSIADEEVMSSLAGEGLLDGIVVGADQQIFHSLNPAYVRQAVTAVPGINPVWFDGSITEPQLIETDDGLVSITPIKAFANERSSFFVYIRVGTAQATQERQAITLLFVLGSVFSLVLTSLAIIYLFNSTILGRIKEVLKVLSQVETGNLSARVGGEISADEIGTLQQGVNKMAAQQEEIVGELEERVAGRTHRLETVATLSERIGSILNLEELLAEIVNQIKNNFGYYHAHIYLFDEARENLVVAEGTGAAGVAMKANKHSIPVGAPKSLVARAVRTGQTVRVDNVREAADWLPNPLLPDTYAEMAVPIILDEHVVGVLDVQQDKIAGLDTSDASLLRSLASTVAIALNNASLFEQTRTALAETEATHQRYLGQAWQSFREVQPVLHVEHQKSKIKTVDPKMVNIIKQQVIQNKKTVATNSGTDEQETNGHRAPATLITPLKLRDQVIGTLGVLETQPDRQWTKEEIALVEAISEQVTLALENARLFEEAQQRAAREKLIANLTGQVWASGELEQVMETTVAQLGATFDASKVIIRLGTIDRLLPASPHPDMGNKQTTDPVEEN